MEAFTLFNYWKGGGTTTSLPTPSSSTTAADTALSQNDTESDDDNDGDEEGPFIDLEFTVPDEEEPDDDDSENPNEDEENDNNGDSEREFKITLSPSSNDRSDPNLSLSPSDDLFFKGKLVLNSSEPNSKPQFTSSLLKSATKFRVFMLGLKKSKTNVSSEKDSNASDSASQKNPKQPEKPETQRRKLFTVKFKVEEKRIVSLFSRDNSSKGASGNKNSQNQKQKTEDSVSNSVSESQKLSSGSDEKRFSKEMMNKYLKKVKPLYIRVSRKYAEKLKSSGQVNTASVETDKGQKQGNLPLPSGLRVVCKHLGKSRSASAAAVTSVSAPAEVGSSSRRDDSLLQQEDGIQSAILHCKRSFNASSSRERESSQLPRCVSNLLHEISPELSRKSTNETKDKRL